jgi:hypothetical protein
MGAESSLNLTPTLSLVRRGSISLVSLHRYLGGLRGFDLGCICKTEMFPGALGYAITHPTYYLDFLRNQIIVLYMTRNFSVFPQSQEPLHQYIFIKKVF